MPRTLFKRSDQSEFVSTVLCKQQFLSFRYILNFYWIFILFSEEQVCLPDILHHAWSLKCSKNAKLYLSTRVCVLNMRWCTKQTLGDALNMDPNKGFRKQQKFNLVEAKQTFTFLYQKNHWEVHALDLICNVSLSKSFRGNKSTNC